MEKRWIWPFELLDKLGEGGMGVVYRARYVVDNRHVAVKLLPPNIANETILSRFERELEILKTLRHPNIVRCFGGKCEGNQHFYAMELVEGGTLDRLLEERSKFTAETAMQFALQMSSGLSYAHERGVVHRDVKPGNFLLTPTGKVKLSDFGLATVEAAAKITAAGKTMGTFPYMAPEQIRGRPPVSPQTDLYALGCVIFEMLTGRTPFTGETPAEVMHKHLDQAPPKIAEFASDCPLGLESLVRDLLQKEPSQRPESAYVVAQRLTDLSGSVEATTAKTRTTISETSTTAAVPRGIVVAERPMEALQQLTKGSWLIPLLVGILFLSLAWNVWSLTSSASQKLPTELWIKAFQTDQTPIREEAAKALGEMSETSPAALKVLISALENKRVPMRICAIEGLMASGPAGRAAVPELTRLKNSDENDQVRQKATQALVAIQQQEGGDGGRGISIFYWLLAIVFVAGIAFAVVMLRRGEETARNSR